MRLKCVAAALVAAASLCAQAQTYPAKQVRFVLPFPPGGPTDILGRTLSQKLTEQTGQAFVLDNRPGAGGNLGAEIAAKSAPDGYTIVLCAPSLAISPHLYKKMNYDPVKDLAPVSLVAQIHNVLLIHPSVRAKTLKELVAWAKSNPGKLNFGSGGVGTSNHLGGELLRSLAKIDIVHVPFKGSNQAMLGVIGGQVDMVVIGTPPAVPQIQAGKVRPLALLAAERHPEIPNVPTAKEVGFPGYEVLTWYGILAPAGTPREIVTRLNAELRAITTSQDGRERIRAAGFDPATSTPEQFAEFIKLETGRWGKVIRDAGIKAEL